MLNADLIVLGGSHLGSAGDLAGRKTVQRLLHGAPCAVAVATPGQSARFGESPRICVAYDASPEARFALGIAYALASETSASVTLCAVVEPVVIAAGFYGVGTDMTLGEEHKRAAGAELELAASSAPAGVAVEQRVVWGTPAHTEVAKVAEGADLIVAGSRGFGALHRAIVGSTSGGLLKNGHTPVLVTPRDAIDGAVEAVAAASEAAR
jgi:nucleotide-binding universal stress UspA family protein